MLDAFKNFTRGKDAQKQSDELEALITAAREERNALSAMLTTVTMRAGKLTPLTKALDHATERAAAISATLDDLARLVTAVDDHTKRLDDVGTRITALEELARQAEQTALKAAGPDGELHKYREAVQQLSSQALQTQATLETLKKERDALEELRGELHTVDGEAKQSLAQSATIRTDLDQIRALAAALGQDYAKTRDTAREARDDSSAALATVKDIENRLVPLARLHELGEGTEERLNTLNALAEHVAHKARVLESQQQAVEHAVVQANRVNEMVWSMDVQIGKLGEGMKQVAKAEETVHRIEKLTADASAQFDAASRFRQEAERETTRLTKEAGGLLDAVRTQVDLLTVRKKELEAVDARLRALQVSVADAESRMNALGARDKTIVDLAQKTDGLAKRFETLFTQADDLTRKQLALDALHERLAQVDDLVKKTAHQMDAMRQTRQDLEAVRKEIQTFHAAHSGVAKLADRLSADRLGLEAFGERLAAFAGQAPELEAKMDAILGKMKLIEAGTQKATRLSETIADLDAQVSRVSARLPFVDGVEGRLNGLNVLSRDVDQKLEAQLARRGEIESLRAACDGLAAEMLDAEQKLAAIRAAEAALQPLAADVLRVKGEIADAQARLDAVNFTEAAAVEQEKRYLELVAAGRAAAADVAERARQMQGLAEELTRAAVVKDEMLAELERVQARQRDTAGQIQASEDQLARAEQMFKQLESRRSQLAFGEKKMAALETRLSEIKQIAIELDKHLTAITSRAADHRGPGGSGIGAPDRRAQQGRSRARHRTPRRAGRSERHGRRAAGAHRRDRRADGGHRIAAEAGRRGADQGQHGHSSPRRHAHQSRDAQRAEGSGGSRRREGGAARVHDPGGAQHAAHPPARARAGRADRTGDQAAAIAERRAIRPGGLCDRMTSAQTCRTRRTTQSPRNSQSILGKRLGRCCAFCVDRRFATILRT